MMLPFSFKEADLFLVISSPRFQSETYTKVSLLDIVILSEAKNLFF